MMWDIIYNVFGIAITVVVAILVYKIYITSHYAKDGMAGNQ